MIELTHEQRQAIALPGDVPIRALDPDTSTEYVLLRADVYERFKSLLSMDEEWAEGVFPVAMEVFARDGWDDPRMDDYDNLESQTPFVRRTPPSTR